MAERNEEIPDVKERLLGAALKLFNERGYAATTVREIVEHAGVTKPVLYYYFTNKEGIYLELMTRPFEVFGSIVSGSADGEGAAVERLLRFCDTVFDLFVENLQIARLMYSIYYGPPQGAPFFDFDAHHCHLQSAIRLLVVEAMEEGTIRREDPDDVMWTVLAALNVAMEEQLCRAEPRLDHAGLRRILKLIFRGIGEETR